MSITATHHDSQHVSALDADLDQLAMDMRRLHSIAGSVTDADERQHFARLEHMVDGRLNQLAAALAMQDIWHSINVKP